MRNIPERRRIDSLRFRQTSTVLLLFGGYAALYFCRADLSVATPLLADELAARGMNRGAAIIHIGEISSFGVLAYALGKLFLTSLGDFWGGKVSFLIGLGGAFLFTLVFTTGAYLPIFTIAWFGNRLTQSVAWAGLIKTSSKWFDFSSYGSIVGILSISYFVGDATARQSMGLLIEHGFGWRILFYLAAAVAGLLLLANVFLLRESRVDAGFLEAVPNPLNLFANTESKPRSWRALLSPLLHSPAFLMICVLSLGCTTIRETFNTWIPEYLHHHLGYGASRAASLSAVFPAIGIPSVLVAGWLSDRLGVNGRAMILFTGLACTAAALLVLMTLRPNSASEFLPLLMIGIIAFCLLGPYSYLGGAFALDFGGKQASAASSGLIDGVGYLGAIAAGSPVAQLAEKFGWETVFVVLAAISAMAAVGAGYLYFLSARTAAARLPLAAT